MLHDIKSISYNYALLAIISLDTLSTVFRYLSTQPSNLINNQLILESKIGECQFLCVYVCHSVTLRAPKQLKD